MTIVDVVADLERRYAEPERPFTSPEVARCCETLGLSRQQFFEGMSGEIARRFDAGNLTFDAADAAVNDLWSIALSDDERWPPLLEQVYRAFDAGECTDPLESPPDPVETETRPKIRQIVLRLGATT